MPRETKSKPMPAVRGRPRSSVLVSVHYKLPPDAVAKLEQLATAFGGNRTAALVDAISARYGTVPSDLELAELLVDRLTLRELARAKAAGEIVASVDRG